MEIFIFFVILLIHNIAYFKIMSKIMEQNINDLNIYIICIINSALVASMLNIFPKNMLVVYIFTILIYYVEVNICFKSSICVGLVASLALPVHVFSLTTIIIAVTMAVTNQKFCNILNTPQILFNIKSIVSISCTLVILFLLKIIPIKYFRMMNQSNERTIIFLVAEITSIICLLANLAIYEVNIINMHVVTQQIILGVSWLVIFYTCMFMLIGFEILEERTRTLQKIEMNELLFRAERDGLSKLYNKITTENLISVYLEKYQKGMLFLIDIDNFKGINDNLGHEMGDRVIYDVGCELRRLFDKTSIVGRIGGDEFVVFVKEVINIDQKSQELCEKLVKTYEKKDVKVIISASVGVIEVSNDINTFKQLYVAADTALYKSKNKGKNTYTIYCE